MKIEGKTRMTATAVVTLQKFMDDKIERVEFKGKPACKYLGGWNDTKIAIATGMSSTVVKRVRMDLYGPVACRIESSLKAREQLKKMRSQKGEALPQDAILAIRSDVERIVDAQAMRLIEATEKQMRKHERVVSHVRQMLERIEMHLAILHGRKIDESVRSDAEAAPQGQLSV